MRYVDGYVIPVPKKNLKAYMKIAQKAAKVWMDHGALQVCECSSEDTNVFCGMPFPKAISVKSSEVTVFSFIVFKSRAHRDKVNKNVMQDPRLNAMMNPKKMPFDPNRMIYGGFQAVVDE